MIKVRLNIDAANQIASELPVLRGVTFTEYDDHDYVVEGIKLGLRMLEGISPVEATCRQLWISKVGADRAFDWLAKHYGLYKVPKKVSKGIDNSEETC